MRLLYGHTDDVAAWVGWRIPYVARRMQRDPLSLPFGPCMAIGVIDGEGALVAGVVYHGYDPDCPSLELSFASSTRKWLTRALISELLGYAFDTAKCRRITGVTPRRAHAARQFLEKFGFKREGLVRQGFGDDDAVISGLLAKEWAYNRFNLRATASEPTRATENAPDARTLATVPSNTAC